MTDSLQDLVGTINNQLLGDKGLRDLFKVVGGVELTQHCGDTTFDLFRCHGYYLLDFNNSTTGAYLRLSGDLPEVSVDKVIDHRGSDQDVRSMVNDMATNFRPIKVSIG